MSTTRSCVLHFPIRSPSSPTRKVKKRRTVAAAGAAAGTSGPGHLSARGVAPGRERVLTSYSFRVRAAADSLDVPSGPSPCRSHNTRGSAGCNGNILPVTHRTVFCEPIGGWVKPNYTQVSQDHHDGDVLDFGPPGQEEEFRKELKDKTKRKERETVFSNLSSSYFNNLFFLFSLLPPRGFKKMELYVERTPGTR